MQLLILVKKIDVLIFVTTRKITGCHLEALTAKNIKVYSLTPHSFTTFARGLHSPQNFLENPRPLYSAPLRSGRCKRLQ